MKQGRSYIFLTGLLLLLSAVMSGQQLASRNPPYRLQCSDVLEVRYL